MLFEALTLVQRQKVDTLEVRSSQENLINNIPPEWNTELKTGKVRMLLNLPESSDALWSGFKSKLRSQVRKAEKNGLNFRWGDKERLDDFYQVFSRNMHNLGSPVHSRKWIRKIVERYEENARMGLVFYEDQPVGCGIILFTGYMVSIPWASTLREFNRFSPNMLLYWSFLQFAADNGKKIFDFGRSTFNEGTYRFKKQWGAKPEQIFWYQITQLQTREGSGSDKMRERLELVWQKMPLSIVNLIGPRLRNFISL